MPIFATVKLQVLSSSDYSNGDNDGNPNDYTNNVNDYTNNSSESNSSSEERRQVTSTSEEEFTNSNARWVADIPTSPPHNSQWTASVCPCLGPVSFPQGDRHYC